MSNSTTEFFFTLGLTENEHYIVEDMMKDKCETLGLTLKYYRKFKTGHVPMQREVKVVGENIQGFKDWLEEESIIVGNYHSAFKKLNVQFKSKLITPEKYFELLRKL